MAYYGVTVTWLDLALVLAGIALVGAVMTGVILQLIGAPRAEREPPLSPEELDIRTGFALDAARSIQITLSALERHCNDLVASLGGHTGWASAVEPEIAQVQALKASILRLSAGLAIALDDVPDAPEFDRSVQEMLDEAGRIDGAIEPGRYEDGGAEEADAVLADLVQRSDAKLKDWLESRGGAGRADPNWFGLAQDLKLFGFHLAQTGQDGADEALKNASTAYYRGYRAATREIRAMREALKD
jgi:hypothetical protein